MVYSAAEEVAHKEEKYHRLYMDIAYRVAEMSHAKRRKVGCVIVKDERIISMGWNGMPTGMPNLCEDYDTLRGVSTTKKEVLHAEANALMNLGAIIGGAGTPAPSSTRSSVTTPSYPTYTSSRTVPSNQLCPQLASRVVKQEVVRGNRICYYQ